MMVNKKVVIRILLTMVICFVMLSGISLPPNTEAYGISSKKSIQKKNKVTPGLISYNRLYNLSDKNILEAINEGKKGMVYLRQNVDPKYKLPIIDDKLQVNQPNIWVDTPYLWIARQSAMRSSRYQNYTLAEGRKFVKDGKASLFFEAESFGNDIDFAKTNHVVLKQGNKIIQPKYIDGTNEFADETPSWPNSPAYHKVLVANFPTNQIDFSKQGIVIFLDPTPEYSVSYLVDFSKLK